MIVPSPASVCRNAPGTSTMAMSLCSCALINTVMNINSITTVGELVSGIDLYSHWGLPSAQPLPLMYPFLFSFRNIRYPMAFCRVSDVMSSGLSGLTTFLLWNCIISFIIAATLLSPHNFITFFIPTWVKIRCSMACCVTRLTSLYVTSELIYAVYAHNKSSTFLSLFIDSVLLISSIASVYLLLAMLRFVDLAFTLVNVSLRTLVDVFWRWFNMVLGGLVLLQFDDELDIPDRVEIDPVDTVLSPLDPPSIFAGILLIMFMFAVIGVNITIMSISTICHSKVCDGVELCLLCVEVWFAMCGLVSYALNVMCQLLRICTVFHLFNNQPSSRAHFFVSLCT